MTTLISCETNRPEQTFPKITAQTIQSISNIVVDKICADSLQHLIHPILLADSLYRFHLTKNTDTISERSFLNYVMTDIRFLDTIPFAKKDSSFLVAQEIQMPSLKLDSNVCARRLPIRDLKIMQDNYLKSNKSYVGGFFEISIPVFSVDMKTAILTVEFNGFHIDSYYKQVYILRQINGSWKIMRIKSIAMA